MDRRLRQALERRGLPREADNREAQDFYAHLSLEEKGRIGVELAAGEVQTGETPDLQTRDHSYDPEMITRSIALRAQTINEQERSVEAVIASDRPVEVYDWRRGEIIDEILRIDGTELPDELTLLKEHNRWELDAVLGSGRQLRRGAGDAGDSTAGWCIVARLFFADGDEDVDKIWNKIRQRHLRNMSVGYRVRQSVLLEPGTTQTVGGREYTAGDRALRIATRWELREVSVVVLGADDYAKIRKQTRPIPSEQGRGFTMNPKLKKYLESIGLRAGASDKEAERFYDALEGEQRAKADKVKADSERTPAPNPASSDQTPPPNPTEPARRAEPQSFTFSSTTDPAAVARQVLADERDRIRQIEELAGEDVPEQLRRQAVHEAWSVDRAAREFLGAVREQRSRMVDFSDGRPGIQSRSHEADCNVRSLTAGLLHQLGLNPTECREYDMNACREGARFTDEDAERGRAFYRMSATDFCREAVRIDRGRYIRDPDESIRAALSGGTLSYVFGTNVYAKLIQGWQEAGDSTAGWCDEEDLANFLVNEEITLNVDGTPELHGEGDTATDATVGDQRETYRQYRFSKRATVDEIAIINDRLGALMRLPYELGMAFRRMRPNLVYSTILKNAALVADSIAVFHASHGNYGSAALGAAGLQIALTAMANQRLTSAQSKGQEPLNIQARYLIVPTELKFTAATLLNSIALAKTHSDSDDPAYMPVNPVGPGVIRQVNGDALTLVSDSRLNATGVWDPMTKAMVPGSTTRWYLSAGPYRGVRVLYRRGTNRQPAVRSYTLDQGQWGLGWDMNLDIGCKIMDFRGLYCSTGAG